MTLKNYTSLQLSAMFRGAAGACVGVRGRRGPTKKDPRKWTLESGPSKLDLRNKEPQQGTSQIPRELPNASISNRALTR